MYESTDISAKIQLKNNDEIIEYIFSEIDRLSNKDKFEILRKHFEANPWVVVAGVRSCWCYFFYKIVKKEVPMNNIYLAIQKCFDKQERISEPEGQLISRKEACNILRYLDDKYNFTDKILTDKKLEVVIVDLDADILDGQATDGNFFETTYKNNYKTSTIVLLRTLKESYGPSYVFFHELGHLISNTLKDKCKNYKYILDDNFKKCGFDDFPNLSRTEQEEIIADVLAMGLLWKSPFDYPELNNKYKEDDREAFHSIVHEVLDVIEDSCPDDDRLVTFKK